jgi:hypothetical protein
MQEVRKGTLLRRFLRAGLQIIRYAATGLTRVGERYGFDWLIYNPLLFLYFFGRSYADAPGVVRAIDSCFPEARRCLDVGAGSGGFAARLSKGRNVVACEYNGMGRWFTKLQGVESHPFDLTQAEPAPAVHGPFDLAYSFEVAEHLPAEIGQRMVEFMAGCAPAVLFTAAIPGQGGMGHVNEQPPEYWIQRFEAVGMIYDEKMTREVRGKFEEERVAAWFATNAIVLRHTKLA